MKTESTVEGPIRRGDVDYSADADQLIDVLGLRERVEAACNEIVGTAKLARRTAVYVDRDRDPEGRIVVAASVACNDHVAACLESMVHFGQMLDLPGEYGRIDFELDRRPNGEGGTVGLIFAGGPHDNRPHRMESGQVPDRTFAFPKSKVHPRAVYRNAHRTDDQGRAVFEFKPPTTYTMTRA